VSTLIDSRSVSSERAKIYQTIAYCAAFIALGLFSASLGPTLIGLARHTGSAIAQVSWLFTARSLGYLLGSLGGGRLYDRLRGHPLMAAALLLMAAAFALAPLIPLLWLLALVLLVVGLGEGTVDVGGNTLLVWVYRSRVGPYMNALHFFFGLGAFLSPIVIALLVLRSGDITWAYWAIALLILPVPLGLLRLPSPSSVHHAAERPQHETTKGGWGLVFLIALCLFLYVGAESGFGGWIFTYTVALGLANETAAAYLTSLFWGSLTLGRFLSIPLAIRFRPQTILLVELVGCVVSVSLILVFPGSLAAVWIGTFGAGFSISALFPTIISFAESRMRITGQVTGLFFVGSSAGGMTVPRIIGQLFEHEPLGPHVTMWVILMDVLIALGVLAVLLSFSRRMTKPAISRQESSG
jgi:MFS transporter, FHS family, Na+ dependent glucose transporter 1